MARSTKSRSMARKRGASASAGPATAQTRKSNRLQDAVYREMFLLESKRPGSELDLALALLRAMVECEKMANRNAIRSWPKSVCPHCLKMIEGALDEGTACAARPQQSRA